MNFLVLAACLFLSAGMIRAQTITTFGPVDPGYGPVALGTWTYDGTNSTLNGDFAPGNVLLGTYATEVDFSGANQIVFTVNNPGPLPVSPFLLTLYDQSGVSSSAVFSWADFDLNGAVLTSPMTPFGAGQMTQVNMWQIVNLGSGAPLTYSVEVTSAVAANAVLPATGGSGPILSGFGAAASAGAGWTYDSGTSTLSGVPDYAATFGGNASVSNYAGATSVSLTASAAVASGAPFVFEVTDGNGEKAFAAFNWASFAGGGAKTVTAALQTNTFFDLGNVQSWTIRNGSSGLSNNVTFYGAGLVNPAVIDTVVDTFTTAPAVLTAANSTNSSYAAGFGNVGGFSANRDAVVEAVAGTDIQLAITNGSASGVTLGSGQVLASLFYTGFQLNAPEQKFLRLDFAQTENLDMLAVAIDSTKGNLNIADMLAVPDSGTPFSYYIDLTQFSGFTPEFMNGVNELAIVFGSSQSGSFYTVDEIAFTSVPEPATWMLLVPAVVAAAAFARRRREW